MFESEALAKDIRMTIEQMPDQNDTAWGSVVLDPSRVL